MGLTVKRWVHFAQVSLGNDQNTRMSTRLSTIKKIAVIAPAYLPIPATQGGAVENLVDMLIESNESAGRFQITCYSCKSKYARSMKNEYHYCRFVYINPRSILFRINQIGRYILRHMFNLNIANAYVASVIAQLLRDNTQYDLIVVENKPDFIAALRNAITSKFALHLHNDYLNENAPRSREYADAYDVIFATSNYLRSEITKAGTATPVELLYNGINLDRFSAKYNEIDCKRIYSMYGIPEGRPIVLYTGRLTVDKGVHILVEAFLRLPPTLKAVLIIVGGSEHGHDEDNRFVLQLKDKAAQANGNEILFTGYIDYQDIGPFYSIADVGVVPSITPEGFSLTALEHMASGHPVIATRQGALVELIDSNIGVLIDCESGSMCELMYQALSDLISDLNRRVQMGRQARMKSLQFSQSAYGSRFIELIDLHS